jgi:hypothetical protein
MMPLNPDETTKSIPLCEYSLIEELKLAVDAERLPTQFTTADIKQWIESDHITKADGTRYADISDELLSNYSLHTPITKKRKQKILYTSLDRQVFSFTPFKQV